MPGPVRRRYTRYGKPAPRFCSSKGVHPKVVQEMLGHGTIAITITMDLYRHSTPSLRDDAARRLGAALCGPLKGTGTTAA